MCLLYLFIIISYLSILLSKIFKEIMGFHEKFDGIRVFSFGILTKSSGNGPRFSSGSNSGKKEIRSVLESSESALISMRLSATAIWFSLLLICLMCSIITQRGYRSYKLLYLILLADILTWREEVVGTQVLGLYYRASIRNYIQKYIQGITEMQFRIYHRRWGTSIN